MDDLKRTPWPNMGISAQDYDPMEFAKLKAEGINKMRGDLTGADCQTCLNKGFIMVPRSDGSIASQECKRIARNPSSDGTGGTGGTRGKGTSRESNRNFWTYTRFLGGNLRKRKGDFY